MLGYFRTALEWGLARFSGCRDGSHASTMSLQRQTSNGPTRDYRVSDRGQTHQASHAGGRSPASAVTTPGQVVRGYWRFLPCYPGELARYAGSSCKEDS